MTLLYYLLKYSLTTYDSWYDFIQLSIIGSHFCAAGHKTGVESTLQEVLSAPLHTYGQPGTVVGKSGIMIAAANNQIAKGVRVGN